MVVVGADELCTHACNTLRRSVCLSIPSVSPSGSRSKAVDNAYRHEYQQGCGRLTLV